ncbi:GGDEF domain-containing protein [Calidifontibacillus erzurumensis]|uniref:GGDEF domain-containing protein n=1 Tax=Calidifontibacillus erzurumensis TaxID=2741433 RepID=UPI0035B5454B
MVFIKSNILKILKSDKDFFREASIVNIHRICLIGWMMGSINIVHIVLFLLYMPKGPGIIVLWYKLVILIHTVMLVVNGSLSLLAYKIDKNRVHHQMLINFVQFTSISVNLLFGILLCVSDQLVTTNINPLLVACIGVSVVFLIPPLYGLLFYLAVLLIFYNMVPLTQNIPHLLDHVRINSVTAAGIGFFISWIMWKNYKFRIKQENIIKKQQNILQEKNEYLQFIATHDMLTGLFNRQHFIELFEKELQYSRQKNDEVWVLLLDIDFFKSINDNYGHPVGDYILCEAAKILSNTIRESDILARLGGEEFIILLPNTSIIEAKQIAENIRHMIETHLFQSAGQIINITVSIGISKGSGSFQNSYHLADTALYYAKRDGRNNVKLVEA